MKTKLITIALGLTLIAVTPLSRRRNPAVD